MALLWFDGFNSQDGSEVGLIYDVSALSLDSSGIESSYPSDLPLSQVGFFRPNASTQYVEKIVTSGATRYIGFRFRHTDDTASDRYICQIKEGSTVHLNLWLLGSGGGRVLELRRGDGTVLATGTTTIPYAPPDDDRSYWKFLNLTATINDTTGAYELRIDGKVEFSATGVDTRNGGTSGVIDRVRLVPSVGVVGTHYDDFYIDDSQHYDSNFRVFSLFPNADGDSTQFTPLAGANYTNVDEDGLYDGDTSYNSSSTVGHKDSLACGALPTTAQNILAVQARIVAKRAAASVNMQTRVRSSGSVGGASTVALTSSYDMYGGDIETTDPNGGAAWTMAGVNAAQVEYEIMASTTNTGRVTKAFLEVAFRNYMSRFMIMM